jgi:hypothetical protein
MALEIDPSKTGLEKVLKDYQIEALQMVWDSTKKGATSREVYVGVNKKLEGVKTISRASIINFLNAMCDESVLTYEEETCKGGTRRKYFTGLDEIEFKKYIVKTAFESLMQDFPEQTMEALTEVFESRGTPIPGL